MKAVIYGGNMDEAYIFKDLETEQLEQVYDNWNETLNLMTNCQRIDDSFDRLCDLLISHQNPLPS